jgi:hypothetical protein
VSAGLLFDGLNADTSRLSIHGGLLYAKSLGQFRLRQFKPALWHALAHPQSPNSQVVPADFRRGPESDFCG